MHAALEMIEPGLLLFPLSRWNIVRQRTQYTHLMPGFSERCDEDPNCEGGEGDEVVEVDNKNAESLSDLRSEVAL